jgi:ribosomal protein S18 acetylase RimI-like enzyme
MMAWQLRPGTAHDDAFLRSVYAATRADELAQTGWDAAQTDAFLRMQFDAQDRQYRSRYPHGRFDIVVVDGVDVGRLYVAREPDRLHVIELALLPSWRRHGLGTALLSALQQQAAAERLDLSIYVEIHNPAQRLYRRLGFHPVSSAGLYQLMQWQAPALAA